MPNGPQKLILIQSGRYDFAEVDLAGTLQIVGPNNTGKTTLINTLQFLYLDDRRHMDFGSYTPEQTRDYYFPNQYSYILFQCLGARGQVVFGWRGQSRTAGGDPERFLYEGPFDAADFLDERHQVREPKAIQARLAQRNFTLVRSAQEHRELLLQATKGESRGLGLVALRDNDKYPHFRETLKNLLSLSTITQDQMRDRLLMLAGLPADRYALDVRELFGEDYDRIVERKNRLIRFKKHQPLVERLVDGCARRDAVRGELIHRWSDLRARRIEFETRYNERIQALVTDAVEAGQRAAVLEAERADRQADADRLNQSKGAVASQLARIAALQREFGDFVPELEQAALANCKVRIAQLERLLGDAERENRDKAEAKVTLYRGEVARRRQSIGHFDRALVTVLRRHLTDDEIAPLARLFNFDLLDLPVGDDGIRMQEPAAFAERVRQLAKRIQGHVYREPGLELPLPVGARSLAELENPDAVRARLDDDEATLAHWEGILKAIDERERLAAELRTLRADEAARQGRLFKWEQLERELKVEKPRWESELKASEAALAEVTEKMRRLARSIAEAQAVRESAEREKVGAENEFNAIMGRFNTCVFPEFDARPVVPDEAIPDDFDAAVSLYLRQQEQLGKLEQKVRDAHLAVESALGPDFTSGDEAETVRLLREELEALPEHEEALGRDWGLQLHQLRATFGQVLQSLSDIRSAADRLNRALKGVQVSNLAELRMEVADQTDIVTSLRTLSEVEQPGLFDDSSGLEAALGGFRKKFEASPLLRYADLFTLRFSVTGDDGRVHRYNDFRQVESHGTTITIKVLFNLIVLRSLLREDAAKALLCEVPFFLDEIHSLDAVNRHAILATARRLGFVAITAAPESVSEVDALYFLRAHGGRIVLRQPHRIRVRGNVARVETT